MRWQTPKKIKNGEERIVRYFALFPTNLDDEYTVWLEYYYAVEQWQEFQNDYTQNHWKLIKTSIAHPNDPGTGSKTGYPNTKYRSRNTGDY
jgi:hypothetical protein